MDPTRPELVPDGSLSRERMRELQREVARAAVFRDDFSFDRSAIESSLVGGVDQAFLEERAVSAVVLCRDGRTVEQAHALTPLTVPYVPGFLSFREGGPILRAMEALSGAPELLLFDGSGRIHFRQAGLATHLGVVLDVPAVGVAKGLLCGTPQRSLEGLSVGEMVAIEADDEVNAPAGTLIGYAVQTRQFAGTGRHVNPVYVSPGHRVSAETAAAVTLGLTAGYKLPEPIRRADAHAAEVKQSAARGA